MRNALCLPFSDRPWITVAPSLVFLRTGNQAEEIHSGRISFRWEVSSFDT
jgi:hypothetical protein